MYVIVCGIEYVCNYRLWWLKLCVWVDVVHVECIYIVTCTYCLLLLQSYARHLSELQEDLKASRSERERLELNLDAVRKDLRVAQNSDVAYAQIYRENERLKHEVKRLKKDSSMDPDSERAYCDRK